MKNLTLTLIFLVFYNCQYGQNRSLKNLYGFGTNTTFIFNDINDTSFIKNVQLIAPTLLAFPGGFGNFYHIKGNGYGLVYDEVEYYHKGKLPKRVKGLNYIINKKNHENYIFPFIDLAKKTNSNVILDINILTAEFEETVSIINLLKKNNLNVIAVEIGRELTNQSYHENFDISEYIKKSKKITEVLNKKFPKIKIGVVAAPIQKKAKRHTEWNNILSKEKFYDAIVVHTYAKITKGKDEYGRMITEYDEGLSEFESFNLYKKRALDFFSLYENEIETYNKKFHDTDIWITEWNLQVSNITGNTHIQALFVFNYLMEVAFNKNLKNIKLMSFHNLAGRDISSSIIINRDKRKLNSTFGAFKLASRIFLNEKSTLLERVLEKEIYKYVFLDENNNKICALINWSNQTSVENVVGYSTFKCYYSANLFDINFKAKNYQKRKIKNESNFEIPPHSIVVLTNE